MKVGDLISFNLFPVGQNVDDIGVIVSITDEGYLDSKIRIAWFREPGFADYSITSVKRDMELRILAILRQS